MAAFWFRMANARSRRAHKLRGFAVSRGCVSFRPLPAAAGFATGCVVRSFLRSWRIWWLALAIAAAPQLSFVHTLSHLAPTATTTAQTGDERQQAPEKTCDTCLLLAHLGQALTAQHTWIGLDIQALAPVSVAVTQIALPAPAHFQARAPPIVL